jgi:hypothetical protein
MRARFTFLSGGLYGLIALGGACANTETTLTPPTSIGPGTTSVSVDPASFLGGVVCTNLPGGMGSFVATVTDITDPKHPFVLPSSPPTSCSQSVYFQYVTPGDSYVADVDGYVQQPDQLVPQCGALPGGKEVNCTLDGQCPTAYGCHGACRVTTYQDANQACVLGCPAAVADAGADAGNPLNTPECLGMCRQITPTSGSAGVEAFVACLKANCGVDDGCLANNSNCLTTEFAALQHDCMEETPGSSAGPDGLLHGAVRACTCAYVQTEGSRQMYAAAAPNETAPLAPRWQTTSPCGAGDMPPVAQYYVNVPIEPCGSLADSSSMPNPTQILVSPALALGSLTCATDVRDGGTDGGGTDGGSTDGGGTDGGGTDGGGTDGGGTDGGGTDGGGTDGGGTGGGGTVTRFDLIPSAMNPSVLAPQAGVPCSASTVLSYSQGIVPAFEPYAFTLYAYEGGDTPTQSADCTASPVEGLAVYAQCDPLAPIVQDAGTD